MPDTLVIRPQNIVEQADYQALTAFYRYAYPQESTTLNALKFADNARPSEMICRRWFAEQNGTIKGVGGFEHWTDYYHPDKYLLHVIVDPQFQNAGIGTLLYSRAIKELEQRAPKFVRVWVQQDRSTSIKFAEKCGFSKFKLKWNTRLDLKTWRVEPFEEKIKTIECDGIIVKSLSEINGDAVHQRKLYELYLMTIGSIEAAEVPKIPNFEEFGELISRSSDDLFFVAFDADRYVGMWQLENESATALYGGIMAVEPDYRRRGAALALAVRGITRAKFFQYKTLTVHTDEHNRAILNLTEKMGFAHLPAQIFMSKQYPR